MKTESDQLRSSLRESNTKLITQESQIECFSKELKQKKEQITWLQEQFTLKKKEAESTTIRLQETLQKYHQKHEEAEQLKTELKAQRRIEYEQMQFELDSVTEAFQESLTISGREKRKFHEMDRINEISKTTCQRTTIKVSRPNSKKAEVESMKPLSIIDKEEAPVLQVFNLWEHGSSDHRPLKLINEKPLEGYIRYKDRSVQNTVQRIRAIIIVIQLCVLEGQDLEETIRRFEAYKSEEKLTIDAMSKRICKQLKNNKVTRKREAMDAHKIFASEEYATDVLQSGVLIFIDMVCSCDVFRLLVMLSCGVTYYDYYELCQNVVTFATDFTGARLDRITLIILAELELNCRNDYEAKKLLTRILDLEKSNIQAITTLEKIYWNNGDRKTARNVFSSILVHSSKKAKSQVLSFWASLEARINSLTIARKNLEMALEFTSKHLSSLITLASLEARSSMSEKAETLYKRAQEIAPNEPHVTNGFAQFLRQLRKLEEAKELLNEFLKSCPFCGISWHILGELALQEGRFKDARNYFVEGISNEGLISFPLFP
eukprot:g6918.t1